jgi:valyl-tRNA synthetase
MFFWVARMIMAGYEWRGEKPFKNVYYTGIVRDKQRRKMSKSLGNSPDPLDLIAQHGADAVRMGMLLCSPAGNDILFDEGLIEQGRNFSNKIWNAFRLVNGWKIAPDASFTVEQLIANKQAADWFNGRLADALIDIESKYTDYKLSEVLMAIYKLIWDDFCAWYLEMIKPEFGKPINETAYLQTITYFDELMRLLHPFMPFVTEELWQNLAQRKEEDSICVASYPVASKANSVDLNRAMECIVQIRNLRNSKGISPKEALEIAIKANDEKHYQPFEYLIKKLANISTVRYVNEKVEQAQLLPVNTDEVYVYLNIEVDTEAEKDRITKEIVYLEGFLKSVDAKLGNEKFIANAKPELVEKERQKRADAEAKLKVLKGSIAAL